MPVKTLYLYERVTEYQTEKVTAVSWNLSLGTPCQRELRGRGLLLPIFVKRQWSQTCLPELQMWAL
jgi:hypothetical protein